MVLPVAFSGGALRYDHPCSALCVRVIFQWHHVHVQFGAWKPESPPQGLSYSLCTPVGSA